MHAYWKIFKGNRSIKRLPKTNMRILLSEHPVNKRKEICEMVHVIPNDKTLQDKGSQT